MTQVSEIYRLKTELSEFHNIVMYGPQCGGKTTLSQELVEFSYISLGRAVMDCKNDVLSQQANDLIRKAAPWPAGLGLKFIAEDVRERLRTNNKVIIDGYPRRLDEYWVLSNWLYSENLPPIDLFLEVTAERDVLLDRYALRNSRTNESQRFFELRYRQYEEFRADIGKLAVRQITYDTTHHRA